jgi:hypothetical protein
MFVSLYLIVKRSTRAQEVEVQSSDFSLSHVVPQRPETYVETYQLQ